MLAGLSEWLDAYGAAWESRDAEAFGDLFTEDGIYHWGPFGARLRGRIMIRESFAEAVEAQQNVEFGYEVMTATQRGGIARWWCSFDRPADDSHERCEGIFRLAFDDEGLCQSLEQWWNSETTPSNAAT